MATDYLRRVEALEQVLRPQHKWLVAVRQDGEDEATASARVLAAAGVEDSDEVHVMLISIVDALL